MVKVMAGTLTSDRPVMSANYQDRDSGTGTNKDAQRNKLVPKIKRVSEARCELIFQTYAQGWG